MPELPDVETWKRYVVATCLHQTIDDVDIDASHMLRGASARKIRDRLKGSSFEDTARHGKYLFIRLSREPWLVLHFGMTGRMAYFKNAGEVPEHTRLLVHFANGYRLVGIWQRRLGRIDLADSPAAFAEAQVLGPDALDPDLDLDAFRGMLRDRRGAVKSALMDQGFIAGIGNVYSDEMLFQARIRPEAEARRLSDERIAALHRALLHVLRFAIERKADPERMPDSWLLPHREEGATCPRCGGTVRQKTISGRTTYSCAACQH